MDFRRRMSWIRVALGVVLAIGGPLTAGAQDPTRARRLLNPTHPQRTPKT